MKCIYRWPPITVNVAPQRHGVNIKYRAVHRLFRVYGRNGVVGVFVFLSSGFVSLHAYCMYGLVSPVIVPLPHPSFPLGVGSGRRRVYETSARVNDRDQNEK